jgi:hypothetical protein
MLFKIFYPHNICENLNYFLQNWGDYTDMSQALLGYAMYASDVLLICWFGTQMTQHVRQKDFL